MRVGATLFNQNYTDWDRYEAEERGEAVAARPAKSDREVFTEEINIARIADETGFDTVWTIEHHFTPYTMVTNPLQYLTYIAGITKRIDLATMVVVLPWHNPVRVAEDINMLDTFLGPDREIICGVGRGLGRREYAGLGIDQAEARGRFDESLQVLRQLLATGTCDFEGEHYNIKGLRLRPQPDRDLSPQPLVRRRNKRDRRDHCETRCQAAHHPDAESGVVFRDCAEIRQSSSRCRLRADQEQTGGVDLCRGNRSGSSGKRGTLHG